jgi:hypothetical protein
MTVLEQPQEAAAPAALVEGTFAVYAHQGGFLVAWRKKGEAETRHIPIPAFVLQMAAQASGGTMTDLLDQLTGGAS